jgi:hypothetical protein
VTHKQHWTDILQIVRWWETHATCSHTQQDSSTVQVSCWLQLIFFWNEANYIVVRASHFLSLSGSSPIPGQHSIHTQAPPPGDSGSNTGELADTKLNTGILSTQPEYTHKLVHHDAGNAGTKYMTQKAN